MVKPPPWPSRPPGTQNFDRFWLVRALPPDPFPLEDYDYGSDDRFGPPGTMWVFSLESLWNRQTAVGVSQASKAAVERLFKKLALKLPPAGSTSWSTPLAFAAPATPVEMELGSVMKWVRTQVIAKLGQDEEVVHVFNWRHSTEENADIDAAGVKGIGNAVRDAWLEFWTLQKSRFPAQLVYTEVRSALLVQDAPATKPAWPLPTQVSPFPAGTIGTGTGITLPYEVALGISFNTNFRGTSRFRGRVYLGPLQADLMEAQGQFVASSVQGTGSALGQKLLAGVETSTDYELHVISQKYNTSAKVTGIRVGQVPDSQRRRRRDRPENYAQVWGTPVGAL